MKMNNRELATVLAALRLWQADMAESKTVAALPADRGGIATNMNCFETLNSEEIDDLCEKLNLGDSEGLLEDIGNWASEIKAGGCPDWRAESILSNVRELLA